jgi:outer membrane protein OmpA-like peptidoglycan-associated protein
MKTWLLVSLCVASIAPLAAGCGGAAASSIAKVSDAERTRSGLAGQDAQTLAPQAFAEADKALRAAKEAERAGDAAGAELHAERAVAFYQHAVALARLTRATESETQARDALGQALEQAQRFAAARKAAEREADDLEKQLKITREAERPNASGAADPERERARLVAAQSLATQARLLCSAARLVSAQAPGLLEAETAVTDLEKKLDAAPRPAPIDAAGRVRAACLGALTKARRTGTPDTAPADLLLSELARAHGTDEGGTGPIAGTGAKAGASPSSDLSPTRDERGVVVTFRSLFKADKLSSEGETSLKELGRIAAAHPTFAVQIVVHDASSPSATEVALDKRRGETVARALAESGATKTKVELAGARAPVFDPADANRRGKNARIEIVFVSGS